MRFTPLLAAFAAVVLVLAPRSARAQDATPAPPSTAQRYFIDFRARPHPLPTGHTYVVYWSTDAHGAVVEKHFDGLHPDGAPPTWLVGLVVPVPATQITPRRDREETPNAIYRVELSATQFARLKHDVAALRRIHRHWHILVFNCNAFIGEVARTLGMKVPPQHVIFPALYVYQLREMNERPRARRHI